MELTKKKRAGIHKFQCFLILLLSSSYFKTSTICVSSYFAVHIETGWYYEGMSSAFVPY